MTSAQPAGAPLVARYTDAAVAVVEARATPRVSADFPLRIWSRDLSGPLDARTRDLSVGGVCVATKSPFSFKSVRRIGLQLGDESLELEAEGRWQSESHSDDAVLTGVSFVRPEPRHVQRLWDVVHDAGKQLARFIYDGSELCDLGADDADSLAQVTRARQISAGRLVYRQDMVRPGDDSIFLVQRGRVSLVSRICDGRDLTVERLGAGGLVGGLPLIAGVPNAESAWADEDSALLEISRSAFSYLRLAKPLVAQRLAQSVARCFVRRQRTLVERAVRGIAA
jgi:CRP-like cAMP-binding protein